MDKKILLFIVLTSVAVATANSRQKRWMGMPGWMGMPRWMGMSNWMTMPRGFGPGMWRGYGMMGWPGFGMWRMHCFMDVLYDAIQNVDDSKLAETQTFRTGKGSMTPCNTGEPTFNFTWSPEELKFGQTYVINFNMTPNVDFERGRIELTVWVPGVPEPMLQVTEPLNCLLIHKVFPDLCPFKKGKEIKITNLKMVFPNNLPIPVGSFKIQAKIVNDDGKLFACFDGTVKVVSDEVRFENNY